MPYTLKIAAKAPVVDYALLTASAFINESDADTIKVEYINEKTIADTKLSAQLLKGDEVVASSSDEILNAVASTFPNVLLAKESSAEWIKFAYEKLTVKNFKELSKDLEKLDAHLNFRSFIIGYKITTADIAVWGCLRANPVMGSVIRNSVYINVSRWYHFLEADKRFGDMATVLSKAMNELKKEAKQKQGGKKIHKANFDIDLPGAKDGEVVTRFPPEPSGYLHIGHAKAAILNDTIAKAYHGKLIIRFDDTNPSKESQEFEDAILDDCKTLGIVGDRITHSSDYFDEMYNYAITMIKEGKAYCDDTPLEKMRAERMDGLKSARRDRSVEDNLHIFTEEMKNGTEEGLKNCLRAKIDYTNKNKALRDPTIYRCNLKPHQRTGDKWKIYPIYDFCVPIVDSLEGVTHALRTIEYSDRNSQYEWMLEALHLRKVYVWDFARVNFVRTLLSKRKLQWFVDKKLVPGWDDPRFPTVRGIMRRGMTVEGLRNFILGQGPSRNIINLDWNIIWAANRKVIDPIATRLIALDSENIVPVTLKDGPELHTEQKPKHKKNPKLGSKDIYFSSNLLLEQEDAVALKEGEEITFMDWGDCIIEKIDKDDKGVVKAISAQLFLNGDYKKTEKKLTWLAAEKTVPVVLKDFDHLITKDKLEEGDNFEDFLTPQTEFTAKAIADTNVENLKVGDIIQFERKGFFRLDSDKDGQKIFFSVPDGRNKSRI
ncbi:glutamate--tRNA ligase [Brettanomyces nanus]|uniref:glutamate--tRNA ligase n=1 Tax=Eeniella nana TaxID=13502 RepID=A0A875S367_EENNA|nr:glutamate--tRNA ligase [Brettanomyces nanus]QPG75786.1 glutamate--tRNA ligase [Brettanomyces nanus]